MKLTLPLDARIIDTRETDERRLPRRLVNLAACVEDEAAVRNVQVIDLSEGGCRIRGEASGGPETEFLVKLTGLEPLRAKIVWTGEGEFGCRFETELHPKTLELIVATSMQRLRRVEPGTRKRLFQPPRS